MALPATGVIEINAASGSDTNGGMYDPSVASPGTDYTQGAGAATFAYTDLVIGVTTTNVTSVLRPFGAADVGNTIHIASGTGFTTGWYNIRSVAGITATLDRSAGTTASTGGTGTLGGALASPGIAASFAVAGNTAFLKSGTSYTISSSTPNISNGLVSPVNGGSGTSPTNWVGYSTNRTLINTDSPAIIIASTGLSNNYLFGTQLLNYVSSYNIIFDGASKTGVGGAGCRLGSRFERCVFRNCTFSAGLIMGNGASTAINCSATGNSVPSFLVPIAGFLDTCEAYSNTAVAFSDNGGSYMICVNCLAYGNTGASSHGFLASQGSFLKFCVAYANGGDGFHCSNANSGSFLHDSCLSEGNTGVAFFTSGAPQNQIFKNCGAYNNTGGIFTSGSTPKTQCNTGFIINTTGSFFVNAASSNFALNNTANQGALARAAGYPALYPRGLTAAYYDSGAAQSQASTGGGMITNDWSGGFNG